MFKDFFKKKKYLDCPLMKESLHFFYNQIRPCCANVPGPIFYDNYKGEQIDWNFIYNERINLIKKIRTAKGKNYIPEECKGCCDTSLYITEEKPNENFRNEIKRIYFHNHMPCNAKCTYCSYDHFNNGYGYDVLPFVKELINKGILSKDALIYMSGGEITISKEFEELMSLLTSYLNPPVEILTSGIKYCESIKDAFIKNKCRLMISLDAGTKEVYKRIKQVDCFDEVVENMKKYINASDNAKTGITLKYIIVDGVNDTKEETERFLTLAQELGIVHVRIDFDSVKYKYTGNINVPDSYFNLIDYFYKSAEKKHLTIRKYEQTEAILKKAKVNG